MQIDWAFNDGNAGTQGSGGALQANGNTSVTITAVNDQPINTLPATVTVTEDTSTAVAGLSIADLDAGTGDLTTRLQVSNGVLNVTLSGAASISAGSNTSSDLTVRGSVADINATLASLAYTGNNNVAGVGADTLTLTTNDGGNTGSGGPLQDIDTIQIDITPVDDVPVLALNTGATVAEGASAVLSNTMLRLDDVDTASTNLIYTITTAPSNGVVRLTGVALAGGQTFTQANVDAGLVTYLHDDTEHFTDSFQFTYADGSSGPLGGPETFNLTINPVNDNDPVANSDSITVAEGGTASVLDSAAASVLTNDTDTDLPNDSLTVAVGTGPTFASGFTLNPDGTFSYTHDGSENFADSFTYVVSDANGGVTDTGTVSITITPVNDNDPVANDDSITVAEGETVTVLDSTATSVLANDTDIDLPNDSLTVSVGAGPTFAGSFTLNPDGTFSYTHDGSENFTDSFTYTVSDANGGVTDTGIVSITITPVNDNDPVISSDGGGATATVSIVENATSVTTVTADDADRPAQVLTFGIVPLGGGGGADAPLFSIDPNTGAVTFLTAPDFESPADSDGDNQYELRVRVTDDGGREDLQDLTIQIVNADEGGVSAIADTDAAADQVSENAVTGTPVGVTARATDPDTATDTVTYSLSDNAGGRFQIDPGTGLVSVLDGGLLDRESVASHGIVVRADSTDGTFATQSFTIAVSDQNDTAPVVTPGQTLTIAENSPNGSGVGVLVASDADLTGGLQGWQITGGSGAGVFAIDAATGSVTVADQAALDLETNPSFELLVTVSDGVQVSVPERVTVTLINANEPPSLAPGNATIDENSAIGTLVFQALGMDSDAGDVLTYSISAASESGVFSIDPATGAIRVADPARLDFEPRAALDPTFTLTVTVTDAQGLSASAPVSIRLSDVNEMPTAVSLSNASAIALPGRVVGQVTVSDPDLVDAHTYALATDGGGRLSIDAALGTIRTSATLNPAGNNAGTYAVDVRVTDLAGNTLVRTFQISLSPFESVDPGPIPPTPAPPPSPSDSTVGPIGGPTTGLAPAPANGTSPLTSEPPSGSPSPVQQGGQPVGDASNPGILVDIPVTNPVNRPAVAFELDSGSPRYRTGPPDRCRDGRLRRSDLRQILSAALDTVEIEPVLPGSMESISEWFAERLTMQRGEFSSTRRALRTIAQTTNRVIICQNFWRIRSRPLLSIRRDLVGRPAAGILTSAAGLGAPAWRSTRSVADRHER
ncbi:MAG: cadherin domain-containing protein [Burkholderiaceae bacterium]